MTTVANPARSGLRSGGTDARELYLKTFSGEILTYFNNATVMEGKDMSMSVSGTRQVQFPVFGRSVAQRHTPGAELVPSAFPVSERTINVDDRVLAVHFMPDIDEMLQHFQFRPTVAQQMAQVLAEGMDQNRLRAVCKAAMQETALIAGAQGTAVGGGDLINAAFANTGSALAAGLFDAAQILDTKNIPSAQRFCALTPAGYYLLAQTTGLMNRDWGGAGDYSKGYIPEVAGITLVKTNLLPTGNDSAVATVPTSLQRDYRNIVGAVWHPTASGTIKVRDIMMETDYLIENQGWMLVAKYLAGHDFLRPESSVVLSTAAVAAMAA